ncbi:MAG: thioesterase family protein [Myxococcota bacterium]|nr:thioesterase family protein [Myxococcota bacterium]
MLEGYTVVVQLPLTWGQMDALAHVNHTQYFRWFEDARMAYFDACGLIAHMEAHGVGPILARTQARFMAPLTYPDTVHVGTRVEDVGDDRFTMLYRVVSERLDLVAAEGSGRIVIYDYEAHAKAPIPPAVRARMVEMDG